MAKSYCICTCIKNSKEYCVLCVKNIARLHKCIHVMTIWDMRKSLSLIHNHNCLMGTITFKVYPITPTSPRIHACNHIWSIFYLFDFDFSLNIFLFKYVIHGLIIERKEIPNDIWHSNFAMPKHTNVIDITLLLGRSIQMSYMIGGQQWWDGY